MNSGSFLIDENRHSFENASFEQNYNHDIQKPEGYREYDGHRHGSMGPHLGSLEINGGQNQLLAGGHQPYDLGPRTISKEEVEHDLAKLQYELEDLTNQLETIEQIKAKPRPR